MALAAAPPLGDVALPDCLNGSVALQCGQTRVGDPTTPLHSWHSFLPFPSGVPGWCGWYVAVVFLCDFGAAGVVGDGFGFFSLGGGLSSGAAGRSSFSGFRGIDPVAPLVARSSGSLRRDAMYAASYKGLGLLGLDADGGGGGGGGGGRS